MSVRDRRCGRFIACFPPVAQAYAIELEMANGNTQHRINKKTNLNAINVYTNDEGKTNREISLAGQQKEARERKRADYMDEKHGSKVEECVYACETIPKKDVHGKHKKKLKR